MRTKLARVMPTRAVAGGHYSDWVEADGERLLTEQRHLVPARKCEIREIRHRF